MNRHRKTDSSKNKRDSFTTSYSITSQGFQTPREQIFYSSYQDGRTRQAHSYYVPNQCGSLAAADSESITWLSEHLSLEDSTQQSTGHSRTPTPTPLSDIYLNIANTFWRPALSFNPFTMGNEAINFESLWPIGSKLDHLLEEACRNTGIRTGVLDLCVIAILCGPVSLLTSLIKQRLIDVNRLLPDGNSLLHLSCVSENYEATLQLKASDIKLHLRNSVGQSALDMCFTQKMKNVLCVGEYRDTFWYDDFDSELIMEELDLSFTDISSNHIVSYIYYLRESKKDVNEILNEEGNYLVHILTQKGLMCIPLLLWLHKHKGLDVNKYNLSGFTSLMMMAQKGDALMADVLMCILGADTNLKSDDGNRYTALHLAAQYNHTQVTRGLLERGIDWSIEDSSGSSAQQLSRQHMSHDCHMIITLHIERRTQLLFHLVEKDDLSIEDVRTSDILLLNDSGDIPLLAAVRTASCSSALVLLQLESSHINTQNCKTGETALVLACKHNHVNMAALLLRFSANMYIKDIHQRLALHYAVQNNNIAIVDLLVNKYNALQGLHDACEMSLSSEMDDILSVAMVQRQNTLVTPCLYQSAILGDADTVYSLLEEGDDINPKSSTGDWPIYLAALNGHYDVFQFLHQRGGNLNWVHDSGNTVLHAAVTSGNLKLVESCICLLSTVTGESTSRDRLYCLGCYTQKRDFINRLNNQYETPLIIAAEKGYSKIVSFLLQHGASTYVSTGYGEIYECTTYEGIRVLIEAHRHDHSENIMSIIEDKKTLTTLIKAWKPPFDHHMRNANGQTPLMIACRLGRKDMVQFLLESAVYSLQCHKCSNKFTDSGCMGTSRSKYDENCTISDLDDSDDHNYHYSIDNFMMQSTTSYNSVIPKSNYQENVVSLLNTISQESNMVSIYHSANQISHISAINTLNGSTCLHDVIHHSDSVTMVTALLSLDESVVNIQDVEGLTALHLACQLNRKKIVSLLTSYDFVDINIRTKDGRLPEEMTKKQSIQHVIFEARSAPLSDNTLIADSADDPQMALTSLHSNYQQMAFSPHPSHHRGNQQPYTTVTSTTPSIDFEILNDRFQQLKIQQANNRLL